MSFGQDDLLLLMTFGFQNLCLPLGVREVDIGLSGAFGAEDFSTFASFCLRLQGHTGQDLIRWLNVPDLVPAQLDAPEFRFFRDRGHDLLIDFISLLECLIESQLTYFTSHGRLREVDDGFLVVLNVVASLLGVNDLDVDDTIDLNQHIILRHTCLWRDLNDLLTKVVHIFDFVDEGDLEVETGFELPVELLKPVQHDCILLANDHGDDPVAATLGVAL